MTELVIVGAGPAGMASAVTAAKQGVKVTLVDENPNPGGQIWRYRAGKNYPKAAQKWIGQLDVLNIKSLFGYSVVDAEQRCLWIQKEQGELEGISYDKLILATGARELFLPFPGWTLPNVMGCGGAQALFKSGMPVKNRTIIISGSGPLLLAVAASMVEAGANVKLIAEQAPRFAMLPFVLSLVSKPKKLVQAIKYRAQTFGVPFKMGVWVKSAKGQTKLESVTLTDGEKEWEEKCDILACGYGLVPNTELATLLGCRVENGKVVVGEDQQTSNANVYCVGETTGIGGVDTAIVEGEIAGLAVAGQAIPDSILTKRKSENLFIKKMEQAFLLRSELKRLSERDTIVCRCEDISFGELEKQSFQREAKLLTRCGMGRCQGKICGAANRFLFGWEMNTSRTPLLPVDLGAMRGYIQKEYAE